MQVAVLPKSTVDLSRLLSDVSIGYLAFIIVVVGSSKIIDILELASLSLILLGVKIFFPENHY